MKRTVLRTLRYAIVAMFCLSVVHGQIGTFTKAQVSDRIRKVEDVVDEFQKYLENPDENARSKAQSVQNSGNTTRRRQGSPSKIQARQDQAKQTKDDLEDATDDLNQSTNRLRRKFNPTSNYLAMKAQWSGSWTALVGSTRS